MQLIQILYLQKMQLMENKNGDIMKRLALSKLIKWKDNPRRKLLVIWGARQVGKTYLIKEMFAKEFYKNNYVYV